MMKAVEEMKNIFINVLYRLMKYMKRSRYLTQNTIKYSSCVLQERPINFSLIINHLPMQLRDFLIL